MAAAVKFFLSGGAANSDPNLSIGGAKSSVEIDSGDSPNLFDDVGTTEASAGSEKYRCLFIAGDALSYTEMGVWISTLTISTNSKIYVGVAPEGKNLAVELLANDGTAPVDVIFANPTQDYATLALPDLAPGDYIGLWIKRVISPGAAGFSGDYARLTVEGTEV